MYITKSKSRLSRDAITKYFSPTGFGLLGINWCTGQRPLNGIICSSIKIIIGLWCSKHDFLKEHKISVTRNSFFFLLFRRGWIVDKVQVARKIGSLSCCSWRFPRHRPISNRDEHVVASRCPSRSGSQQIFSLLEHLRKLIYETFFAPNRGWFDQHTHFKTPPDNILKGTAMDKMDYHFRCLLHPGIVDPFQKTCGRRWVFTTHRKEDK